MQCASDKAQMMGMMVAASERSTDADKHCAAAAGQARWLWLVDASGILFQGFLSGLGETVVTGALPGSRT